MRIVALSDTHGQNLNTKWKIPDGDVLVHAGDGTARGTYSQIKDFGRRLSRLPHEYKIYVPGNHDRMFQLQPHLAMEALGEEIIVLIDDGIEIDGIRFWGSPWIRWVDGRFGFEAPNAAEAWDKIPPDTDVLITHSPPYGVLDYSRKFGREHIGETSLMNHIVYALNLKVHVFGHNHGGHGNALVGGTRMYNVSLCDDDYRVAFEPTVIDLEVDTNDARAQGNSSVLG